MLGLTAAAMAKTMHARSVTMVDTLPDRLEKAKQFGADHGVLWDSDSNSLCNAIASTTGIQQFDVLLEFSGASAAVGSLCNLCGIGGRVILVGTVMPSPTVAFDPEQMVRRCMSIRGVHNYATEDLVYAIHFLQTSQHLYSFASLVEKSFGLDEANEAIDYANASRPVRTAIFPLGSQTRKPQN